MKIDDQNIRGLRKAGGAPPKKLAKASKKKEAEVAAPKDEFNATKTKYGFTEGNVVLPLETGGGKDEIVPKIAEMVSGAKTAVQVQMYKLGHNKIVDVLADQARKGVKVQVLLDPTIGYNARDTEKKSQMHDFLRAAGVEILKYPIDKPAGKIDHVKMLIVDGKSLLIGGMNWDQHSPLNKDFDVVIKGPAVGDAQDVFNHDWKLSGGKIISGLKAPGPQKDGDAKVRMLTTEVDRKDIDTALQENINKAEKSIMMEAFALADKTTIQNLINAKERGVDVRVILDPNVPISFINKKSANILKEAGVKVKWRDVNIGKREKLHAKMAIFDEKTTILGSCNFSHKGLAVNHEANVEVISDSVGNAFTKMFERDWKDESIDEIRFLPDFNEKVGEQPPAEQMAKELLRYSTKVFYPGRRRIYTGKKKKAILSALEDYGKVSKPASPKTLLGNSGKEFAIDESQEMEVIGDLASHMCNMETFEMKPGAGDSKPLYDHRVEISKTAAEEVPDNVPRYLDDMVKAIENKEIKDFVKNAISQLPEGFLKAPSASSGKFHPADEVDPNDVDVSPEQYPEYRGGGLVLHSRRVQKMAGILCEHYGVEGIKKDEILAAMALHDAMKGVSMDNLKDALKNGDSIPWEKTTTPDHGHVASEWIKHMDPTGGKMTKNIRRFAANHMSIWNEPQPTPAKDIGEFISSVSDYVVSQKNFYLEV